MGQRRPATFCPDCGKPISSTAFRRQRCALGIRANLAPISLHRADSGSKRRWDTLTAEAIRQIRDAGTDLQAAILAHRLNVDRMVLGTIRGGHVGTELSPSAQLSR